MGQIWLEEDLYSPQDFVLPKSNQELAADREFLIETKDYYYDYHYRLDEWSNSLALDSTLQLQLKSWQRRGLVANIPSSKHRLLLADGVRLDLSSSLTLEALKAQYGLPDDFLLPPTYTLNTAKTDSALQAKLDLIPENKGIITLGTLLL